MIGARRGGICAVGHFDYVTVIIADFPVWEVSSLLSLLTLRRKIEMVSHSLLEGDLHANHACKRSYFRPRSTCCTLENARISPHFGSAIDFIATAAIL